MAAASGALRQSLNAALARADRRAVIAVRSELEQLSAGKGEAAREASALAAAATAALKAVAGLEAECKKLTPYAKAYIELSGDRPIYRCKTHKGDPARTVHTWPAS